MSSFGNRGGVFFFAFLLVRVFGVNSNRCGNLSVAGITVRLIFVRDQCSRFMLSDGIILAVIISPDPRHYCSAGGVFVGYRFVVFVAAPDC
ncbi:MAG: hypothetical protein ACRD3W_22260, partial [Terriglobales bacterium]